MVRERRFVGDDCRQQAEKLKKKLTIMVDFKAYPLTFLHSWKMANEKAVMNEKNDNCRAFQALSPRTPKASGMSVMAFNKTKTNRGMKSFFNFDLRAK